MPKLFAIQMLHWKNFDDRIFMGNYTRGQIAFSETYHYDRSDAEGVLFSHSVYDVKSEPARPTLTRLDRWAILCER